MFGEKEEEEEEEEDDTSCSLISQVASRCIPKKICVGPYPIRDPGK